MDMWRTLRGRDGGLGLTSFKQGGAPVIAQEFYGEFRGLKISADGGSE